jgi:hypothetical protein
MSRNVVTDIVRVHDMIRNCIDSDKSVSKSMLIGDEPNIAFRVYHMVHAVVHGHDKLVRKYSVLKCPASAELFFLFLEKGWLQSATHVMNRFKFNMCDYAVTNAFLSNMETKREASVLEFDEMITDLKKPFADSMGSHDYLYDEFLGKLICDMRYIQIEHEPSTPIEHQPSVSYDINMKDTRGRTPLFRECLWTTSSLGFYFKCWCFMGADFDTVDIHENTLMHAIGIGWNNRCTVALDKLHELNPRMFFARNVHGNTPLHLAVSRGHHLVSASIIKHFFSESDIVSEVPPQTNEFKDYINTKNNYGRSALEMIMQPLLHEQENGLWEYRRDGSRHWCINQKCFGFVMCAGLLITCGAYVSDKVSLWLESLAKKEPNYEILQLVAARALTRQIYQGGGITDTRTRVERIVMEGNSMFF